MSKRFLETDGDLREVMHAMFASPEFQDPANIRSKVKSPLEMVASAIRAVNGDIEDGFALVGLMNQLGEPLYRKLEPTGYSNRGADWMNSASLVARMNFAIALTQSKIAGVRVDAGQFAGDASMIERELLLTDASADNLKAIGKGPQERWLQSTSVICIWKAKKFFIFCRRDTVFDVDIRLSKYFVQGVFPCLLGA